MRKNPSSYLLSRYNRGTSGKVFATILAFLFGIIVGIGGLFGSGYFVISRYTIKEAVSTVGNIVGTDIDYTQYVSEDYANKTVLTALQDVFALAQKGDSLSFADLNAVSPAVGTQLDSVISTLKDNYSINMSKDELMNTPFSTLGTFISDTLVSTELGGLLSSPGVNMLTEESANYDLLMLICYGNEGEDYEIVNGEVVMQNGKEAATINDLFGTEGEGIVGVFNNLEFPALLEAFGSEVKKTSLTDALFYTTDEESGETRALTVKEFLDNLAGGNLMDLAGDVTIKDALNVTTESSSIMIALAHGSQCEKDENGEYIMTDGKYQKYDEENGTYVDTGDYYIDYSNDEKGEIVMLEGHELKTLKDLQNSEFIDGLKIGDLIGTPNSSLMKAISDWTISDLNKDDNLNGLYLCDVMGIDETSSSMMIALAYGTECEKDEDGKYIMTDGKYQKYDEENDTYVDTGDYIYNTDGKIEMVNGHTPTTLAQLKEDGFINSLKIGDLIGTPTSSLMKAIRDWTISDLNSSTKINELYLCDVMDIDETSSPMMIALAYGTECEKDKDGEYIKNSKGEYKYNDEDAEGEDSSTGDYIITEEGKIEMVNGHTPTTLAQLKEDSFVESLKIGDLLDTKNGSSRLLTAISDWSMSDLKDESKINSLKISDLLGDSGKSNLLTAISGYTLGDLSNGRIESEVTISALLGEDTVNKNFLLKHIASSTLNSLSEDISALTVTTLFENDIYEKNSDGYFVDADNNPLYLYKGQYYTTKYTTDEEAASATPATRVVTGTWKYMLTENGELKDYTLSDFGKMVTNMKNNMQSATLFELRNDGILSLNEDTLKKDVTYKNDDNEIKTIKIGDMTITQLVSYVAQVVG